MKRRRKNKTVVDVDMDEIRGIVDSSATGPLREEQRNKLLSTLELLVGQIDPEFRNSEKLNKLVREMLQSTESTSTSGDSKEQSQDKKKRKGGNGRTPAAHIKGAEIVSCPHHELKRGDLCPDCKRGKVYPKAPEVIVRFKGGTPVQATKYELERLRCNLCGQTFTAEAPKGIGKQKYDESVASILGLLIYGGGLPRNRLADLQGKLGVPLPQSTQWELLDEAAEKRASAPLATSAAIIGGVFTMYVFGILGMAYMLDKTIPAATMLSLSFIPGDLVKAIATGLITAALARTRPASILSRG